MKDDGTVGPAYSLTHADMALLRMANRNGVVFGKHGVLDLAGKGFLEPVGGHLAMNGLRLTPKCNEYALTEKGRDAVAVYLLTKTVVHTHAMIIGEEGPEVVIP